MTLTVVVGLPGSGATERVLAEMGEAARKGRAALLVLPSDAAVETARAGLSRDVTVGVRIATLDGALQREWSLHGDGRALVTRVQRDVLAKRALSSAGVTPDPGRGAVSMLATLVQRHAAIGARPPGQRPGLAGRLLDAIRTYRAALDRHALIEPAEAARSLAAAAAPADSIGVAGFAGLRPEEEAVIAGWAVSADVWIELPWADGVGATEALEPLIRRLVACGAVLASGAGSGEAIPPELRRVATSLFSAAEPQVGDGVVRMGVGRGAEGEAEVIASVIVDLVAEGERPRDIVVAFPDAARHAGWVAHELRGAGVPVQVDVFSPAAQTPFGRALATLCAAASEPEPAESTVAFLRTPFAGVETGVADRADFLVRAGRSHHARVEISRLPHVRRLLSTCGSLSRARIDRRTIQIWKELADSLLSNAYPGDSPVLEDVALQDAAAHRLFCRTAEQLLLLGDGEAGADDLFEAFRAESVRPRSDWIADAATDDPGSVLVTTLDGLRRARPRNGIVGGLTASEFPGWGSAERLEGGAVRGAMAALGVESGPDEQGAADRLAFYLAVTAPTRSLALTRRDSDDEGRALRESVFWDEFLDLYRVPGESDTAGGPQVARSSALETRRIGTPRARGSLADDGALADLASIDAVSPSQVEVYLRCPYRWFVERRLKPEEPDQRFDARLEGSLAHDALAAFYRRLVEIAPRVTPGGLPRALELAADAVAEVTARAPKAEGLAALQLLADVAPSVERTVTADATFLPDYAPVLHEWSFGPGTEEGTVDLGGVVLKGRADRVDVGPDGLVVVDYKLSKVTPVARFEGEHLVQLQLYAAAASRKLGVPVAGGLYRGLRNGKVRGFVLDGVPGTFMSTDRRDRESIDALVASAIGSAAAAFDGMRRGRIEPTPSKEACATCPAAAFCPRAVV